MRHGWLAQIFGIVTVLSAGQVSAQALDAGIAQVTKVLFARCAGMEEPLEVATQQCTDVIRSGHLSEAQVGEAIRYRGMIALRQERYAAAMQDMNLSIQFAPEAGRTYYIKGLIFEATGDDRRADGQYRNAFLYAPEDPDVIAKVQERNLN